MTDEELEELRKRKIAEMERKLQVPDSPVIIDGPERFEEVLETYEVVIVDFHAEWCGPCKQQEPILESIASTTDAVVAKVDIDQHQGIAQSHGVRSVPTLILFADGEPTERLVGVQSAPILKEHIEQLSA